MGETGEDWMFLRWNISWYFLVVSFSRRSESRNGPTEAWQGAKKKADLIGPQTREWQLRLFRLPLWIQRAGLHVPGCES